MPNVSLFGLIFSKWKEGLGGNLDLMVSGSAALQTRLARVFAAAEIPVMEGYGLTETSPVISIHANLVGYHVSIFPNPLEKGTKLYANFSGNDKGAATVFLSDMAGKLISTYLFDDIEPGGIYLIKDESLLLPKGNYFVEIKTQQSVRTEKLVVK